ncbi:MAG: alkaline phosphatase family protein [Tatlockia sp.]|nr:alkaline phosphatase family protein [Tatlockia sp.]
MKKIFSLILFFLTSLIYASSQPPKLVVQLIVDQLRGDLINLHRNKFGTEGFNFLLSHSLDYRNAHQPQANTVTCVGHANIATGSYPALHGIIGNEWFDKTSGKTIACVDDSQSGILPTPRSKKILPGSSPHNLVASTLSDEIVLSQKGRAFAVSFKARAAITMAGHAGKAFWFDKLNGGFITSNFYYSAYPQWVADWNKGYEPQELTWSLMHSPGLYNFAKAPRFSNRYPDFGVSFPHKTGGAQSDHYFKLLSMTPFADELTADFAINILEKEQLGKSPDKTDYLSISFSATDVIGHQFGPNSLESEDNLQRLDKTLARVLVAINKSVGLENTLIVLTADHGVSDSPAYLASHKILGSQTLSLPQLRKSIEDALAQRYQLPAASLEAIAAPYIYLNHQFIIDHHLTVKEVSTYLAEVLSKQPGMYKAYALPLEIYGDWLSSAVNKMAFPERSGDLYLVTLPYEALVNKNEKRVAHGSPWNYDSYIPLLFVSPVFKGQPIFRPVSATEIAPTISAILNIKQPSASSQQPLMEVMQEFGK